MDRIQLLRNPIREYAWGSRTALAELLGEGAPASEPQAELWIGAHPAAPSQVRDDGSWVSLGDWIERDRRRKPCPTSTISSLSDSGWNSSGGRGTTRRR